MVASPRVSVQDGDRSQSTADIYEICPSSMPASAVTSSSFSHAQGRCGDRRSESTVQI